MSNLIQSILLIFTITGFLSISAAGPKIGEFYDDDPDVMVQKYRALKEVEELRREADRMERTIKRGFPAIRIKVARVEVKLTRMSPSGYELVFPATKRLSPKEGSTYRKFTKGRKIVIPSGQRFTRETGWTIRNHRLYAQLWFQGSPIEEIYIPFEFKGEDIFVEVRPPKNHRLDDVVFIVNGQF